jgi:predicted transcriptional regulator
MSTELTAFDYAPLGNSAETVKAIAKSINQKMRATAASIIAIGRELRTARGILGVSVFGHWIEAEFGFTDRTARNYIAVAQRLGQYEDRISTIPPATLYVLAAKSVPEEAIETVIARTEAGETVSREEAREIIDESRDTPETVAEADEEDDEQGVEFDEPTNGIRDPAKPKSETVSNRSTPKPNIATHWAEASRHLEAFLGIYEKYAQQGYESADIIATTKILGKSHEYYVRNVEAV